MTSTAPRPLTAVLCVLALGLATCVDPSQLDGFECDPSGGSCVPPGQRDGGAMGGGGGGAMGGGGGAMGGGGGAMGGGGGEVGGGGGGLDVDGGAPDGGDLDAGATDAGAPDGGVDAGPTCGAATCSGCCVNDRCVLGDQQTACGGGGVACVDCGSGQRCVQGRCEVLITNGGACSSGPQCASGKCAAGVCCNSACAGACETCNAMGSEGRCTPLPEASAVAACGDYACDGVSGACPSTCTTQRQCAPGRYCNSSGACVLLKVTGATCQASPECASGFCADGVCCAQACTSSCDRCNLQGQEGTCRPAPANDPGSPACGGLVTCNGTLSDCPILCAAGCPANAYCSGQYCTAKKPLGAACAAAGECVSSNCADGVCCDSACAGACDACSVANGAAVNGTCALLGSARVCRAAADSCDAEERCSGTSPDCPANAFASSGTTCGQTTYDAWSACSAGTTCATSGMQSRTRTDRTCNGMGACLPVASGESQSCTRVTDGASCGTTTYGAWTACTYPNACAGSGSRTRARVEAVCSSGSCGMVMTTETDTAGCARSTNGVSCGAPSFGAWSACSYATPCSESGTRTRSRTDAVCSEGSCGMVTTTETDSTGCARATSGQSCGTTTTGAWGTCSYGETCSTSGSRTRSVTTFTCGSGACNSSSSTETDTAGCGRTTTGTSCGTTTTGNWGACGYADTCATSGTRSRSVTSFACSASGTCQQSTNSESDTSGCGRTTSGTSCGTTQYGAWSACSYASTCAPTGTRTRSVTSYACNASGTCQSSTSTETDTTACNRNTDGTTCGTTTTGNWGTCGYADTCSTSGTRTRTITSYACGSGICNANNTSESDSSACGRSTTGTSCGATQYGAWSACSYPSTCSPTGSRTRSVTSYACNASGACQSSTSTETDTIGCNRNTDGATCGTTTTGNWGTCGYADTCSTSGTRNRTVTTLTCGSGVCNANNSSESDSSACGRTTTGTSCGTTQYGAWSACSYPSTCSPTGSRTRSVTTYACNASGSCQSSTSTETDTTGCNRNTDGATCGTTTAGNWGTCGYADTCSTSGTRTRTLTAYTCGSGICNSSNSTESDSSACGRSTTGTACGTTQYGAWSACSYASTCALTGSRTRSVTSYACNASGACQSSSSTETDTSGCNRDTNGSSCDATQYGAWSACSYGSSCTNSGSRSRSMTTYTCGSGTCNGAMGTDTDTAGCARDTEGSTCGSSTCGSCRPCNCDCERVRTCQVPTCRSEVCVIEQDEEVCSTCSSCFKC